MTQNAQERLARFLQGVLTLPPFGGLALRGCPVGATVTRPGQRVRTRGITSCTCNPSLALAETPAALYAIWSRTGRDISAVSAARDHLEVVFVPGTVLHLAESREVGGHRVHLVFDLGGGEIEPPIPDALVDELAGAVGTLLSRTAPQPSTLPPPGKFSGDLW